MSDQHYAGCEAIDTPIYLKSCRVRFMAFRHRTEKGVVLFMALIALVAMTMAALALVHSVATTNLVASNVVLKEAAVQEGDIAMNIAFHCLDRGGQLTLNSGLLQNIQAICNYFPYLLSANIGAPYGVPDVLKVASPPYGVPINPNPNTGNYSYYVIERMCNPATTVWTEATCMLSPFGKRAAFRDEHSSKLPLTALQALYRITVKVSGPRGVTSYSQMIVNASI